MAFVKLDCGILNSTLWVERHQRDVFITALLLAVPMEVREPTPQIKIGAIEETGFVVPPGWYGFVQAAGPGIVRMAIVDHDEGMAALAKLGDPDDESRSSEFEGRRLVRVDGGFLILNYMKYRDKDETGAQRAKRYRERKAMLEQSSRVTDVTSRVTRHVASLAEAEAEAEALIPIPAGLRPATAPASPDSAGNVDLTGHQLNGHAPKTVPDCPHKEILELWAKELPELAQHDPALWPESARAENLRARWRATAKLKGWTTKEDGLAYFAKLFRWCRASDFLMGRTSSGNSRRPFRFELAWLVNATNWTKVHEGRFNE